MNTNITIRMCAPEEWATYRDLRLRSLADSPDAFGTTLAEARQHPDAFWADRVRGAAASGRDLLLLAIVDDVPAGLTWGVIDPSHAEVAHVYQVWVTPDYRGDGIGRRLMEAVIAWARDNSVSYVDLGVTLADSPAMRLYRRLGFQPAGKPQPFSGRLGQPMRLEL